jgi:hypothetical protein
MQGVVLDPLVSERCIDTHSQSFRALYSPFTAKSVHIPAALPANSFAYHPRNVARAM